MRRKMLPTKRKPTRSPHDLCHRQAPPALFGALRQARSVRCGGSSKPSNSSSPRRIAPGAVSQNPGAAGDRRTRFQHQKQNRHVAAFDQATTWRAHKCLARGTVIGARRCGQGFDDAPPQWAEHVGLRPGLLRQVAQKHAVHDAGGSAPVRDEGRFTDTRARPCLWNFHATPQARGRKLRHGRSRLVAGVGLAASGHKPVKPSRGDVESAMSPFGSGRPVRPWSVVNPGEGTAAPWASWPQPSSANNLSREEAAQRRGNCLRFQVLHGVATAARCSPPIPRRPDHNKDALARSCSTRKENHHG